MMQPVTPDHAVDQVRHPEAAQDSPLISLPEIERFLHYYDGALEMADARLGLFSLPGRATFASQDAGAIARRAAELAASQHDVYLHVHLHELPEGACSQRGSRAKVRAAIGLFSDIDARGPGRKKPPETLCPTVEDTVSVVTEFETRFAPLKTSLLIHSGHGIYPAILFKEAFLTQTAEEKALLESLGRRFHNALHEIASGHGWTGAVDYCDAAKVLRLPGCVNWKDPNDPKSVRLIHEDPARFDPSDLAELLPHLDGRRAALTKDALAVDGGAVVNIAVDTAQQVPESVLKALVENHPLFAPTWSHQRVDLKDQSCSGYDLAIASIAVTCGLNDQHIANLIMVHRTRFPGPKQERHGHAYQKYLERTIARAHQGGTSPEGADRNETQDQQVMEVGVGMPPQQAGAGDQAVPNPQRRGTTLEDIDQGHRPRQGVHSPVDFLIAKVRATGDVKLVYDRIGLIATLPEAEVAVVYQDLKAALGSKLNYNHFSRALQEARTRQQQKSSDQQSDDPRPAIVINYRLLDAIAADAITALEAANEPPVLFRRGGNLVMVHPDEDGRPIIMRTNEPMMRGRLARVARFVAATKSGMKAVSPPEDLTLDVLASNEGRFPALGVLTQIPILHCDGTLRLKPGYDPATRAYYVPTPGFHLAHIPDNPSPEQIRAAVHVLLEVIAEFPFESAADRANFLGLLLTPVLRVAFRMYAPLALIDAPKWGSGKTLLSLVAYTLITGSEGTVCAAPTTEEEWRKRMTSILERGSAITIVDNVDATLRSPALSAVLTSSYWEDRVLGRSEDVRLPSVSTWIATGNNIALGAEMARRAVRIRLDAKVSNPAKRTGFKRTDQELLDWVRENRGELVAALFTLVRAWWAAGQPKGDVPPFGSFNTWARQAGGILQHAGIEGFLANLDAVQQQADEESTQWDQFLRALVVTFGELEFSVADIVDHVEHERSILSDSFPDEIGHPDERADSSRGSLVRRTGKALGRKCGTRFGDLDLRIERGRPDNHTKIQRWRVAGNLTALLAKDADESAGLRNED